MPGSATTSDTLDFEFQVLTGRYSGCKFWEFMPLDVSLDPKRRGFAIAFSGFRSQVHFCLNNIDLMSPTCGLRKTRSRIKAMIDSALGLNPDDESPSARPKRILSSLSDLDRIEFVGKISVEKVTPVLAVNRLASVITPDDPRWRRLMGSRAAARLPMGRT
jgi:hypothetical protein